MPILCCYAKRRRASPERDIFGIRLARLDEFESLTPLMVMTDDNNETSFSRLHRITSIASRSPPPPRCMNSGKTMIVPLNSGKGCAAPFASLLTTLESKSTLFENDVTQGQSTIVDENVLESSNVDKFDADFIPIKRTAVSYLEPKQQRYQQCECGIPKSDKLPTFELPTPSYAPPPLPTLLVRSPRLNLRKELPAITESSNSFDNDDAKTRKSASNNSVNSLGSPQDSSFSTGSPLDTSASISGSFCAPSEGETISDEKGRVCCPETRLQKRTNMEIYGFSPELDYSMSEQDSEQKYVLHRIEEESEQNGDIETTGIATSGTLDSIKSAFSQSNQVDSQCNIIIPHSISQQFELMNLRKCL
ncbi:unnamed protein product [Litomosoides sigmodontis]|uniref:Uncharacterized protein n=1 Tax=Litomosoides sigmodontis TaxID=42156 RepID=A0A3P6SJ58_LITSI|nr:unnamed protein product [Litomosoides sigmodontis]